MEKGDDTLFGDLEDQVTCWVCFEIFKDPITLHCAHTFCKDCALQVHKKNPVCPFCRRPYDLPLSDTNKDVVALVDQYLQKKSGMDVEKPTTPSIVQDSFLLRMPREMLWEVLQWLPPKDIGKCGRVSRTIHEWSSDPWVWRDLCQRTFPFCSVDKYGKNWKWCFIGRSNIHKGWEGGKAGDFEVVTLRGHQNYVNCFKLYRNNIVSGSADSNLKIWKTESSDPIHTLVGHSGIIQSVEFNEVRIVSASTDSTIKIWDTKSGLPTRTLNHNGVTTARFDDTKVVSGGSDQTVKIWDVRDGSCTLTLNGHTQKVNSVEFDNNKIYSAGHDCVKVWDVRNGSLLQNLQGGTPSVMKVLNGKVIVGQADGDLKMYDASTGFQTSFPGARHYAMINDLHTDGKVVVTASTDGTLKVWDLATQTLKHTLSDHKGSVNTVQLSGSKVVSGGIDNSIKVWNITNGNRLYTLLGGSLQQRSNNPVHPSKPGCSHLEFDDSRIVASFASLVRVYDFETFKAPSK